MIGNPVGIDVLTWIDEAKIRSTPIEWKPDLTLGGIRLMKQPPEE
jgi:hypothetical protein